PQGDLLFLRSASRRRIYSPILPFTIWEPVSLTMSPRALRDRMNFVQLLCGVLFNERFFCMMAEPRICCRPSWLTLARDRKLPGSLRPSSHVPLQNRTTFWRFCVRSNLVVCREFAKNQSSRIPRTYE